MLGLESMNFNATKFKMPGGSLNWTVLDSNGNVVGHDDDPSDTHVYLDDCGGWDGTQAGLSSLTQIGWEISGYSDYRRGRPCFYIGQTVSGSVVNGEFTGTAGKALMYGNSVVNWDSNGDGKLQKDEADNWWLNGWGIGISVDNSKINWTGLQIDANVKVGQVFSINTTQAFIKLPYETAATYGGTSFILIGTHSVEVIDQLYHYKYRPNNSAENITRNVMTWLGKPDGQGTDYMIHYINPLIIIK